MQYRIAHIKSMDKIITIARKDYRASEVVALLAKARRQAAELAPTEYAHGLALKDIAKFAAALEAAGIAEDAQIEKQDTRSLAQQRADASKAARPANPYRAVGRIDAEAGDINNLLRSNGNDAAAE